MAEKQLGFLYLRGVLSKGTYHDRAKKIFVETYNELLRRKKEDGYNPDIINFMIGMMDLAKNELDKGDLVLASYDINILHNLPGTICNEWDKKYFYEIEMLGYIEHMANANRCDKISKIIELDSNNLYRVTPENQATK